MAVDLTPTAATSKKNKGCGWGLEPDELGHEFLRPVQLLQQFVKAEAFIDGRSEDGNGLAGTRMWKGSAGGSSQPFLEDFCVALCESQMVPSSR